MDTQVLRIYRRHTKECTPNKKSRDCSCPLAVAGYLRNVPGRVRHHSLKTNDWAEARRIQADMLGWGSLTAPGTGLETLKDDKVTVEDAIKFFFECGVGDGTKGRNTTVKYTQLLKTRLLPWCEHQKNPVRFVKEFDNPITVRAFLNSWRKRTNVDNRICQEGDPGTFTELPDVL
jgi:hypothetical protein